MLVVQWALILIGLYGVIAALHLYRVELVMFSELAPAAPGQDSFSPPTFQRMVQGVTTGLIAVGLGGVLLYLRRLYLLGNLQ